MLLQPNPSSGKFDLILPDFSPEDTDGMVMIYNQSGQLVHQQRIKATNSSIHLKQAPAGLYLVGVRMNGKMLTQKILIH